MLPKKNKLLCLLADVYYYGGRRVTVARGGRNLSRRHTYGEQWLPRDKKNINMIIIGAELTDDRRVWRDRSRIRNL